MNHVYPCKKKKKKKKKKQAWMLYRVINPLMHRTPFTVHFPCMSSTPINLVRYLYTYVCVVGTLPDMTRHMSHVTCHMSHGTGYILYCIILCGKLKEATTGSTNPMYTMAAPVLLVVSYGTTRLLSNSPAHSHSRSLTQINYDTSQLYCGFLIVIGKALGMTSLIPDGTIATPIKKPWYSYKVYVS